MSTAFFSSSSSSAGTRLPKVYSCLRMSWHLMLISSTVSLESSICWRCWRIICCSTALSHSASLRSKISHSKKNSSTAVTSSNRL